MERVTAWISDKKPPRLGETKTGKAVLEIPGSVQTDAYEAWAANGKQGEAPARYIYVNFSVFENQIPHAQKIIARPRPESDPRAQVLFLGRWAGSREYEGKTYANFWVSDLSPLLWGPLSDRG